MSIYDVIDDISAKQAVKSETGDSRINGVIIGVVTKNFDERIKGRVCVEIPTRDAESNELLWARVAQPSSGKSWGHYFQPEVGDQVLLAFEGGNIERPYVIGCVPRDNSQLVAKKADKDNVKKAIVSTGGNALIMDDTQAKEAIEMNTAGDTFQFSMHNGDKKIMLTDKDKEHQIIIDTQQGRINIKAKAKLVIQVGGITMTFNGNDGIDTVKLEAQKLNIQASAGITLKTDGTMNLEGANVNIKATASLKGSSDGVLQMTGSVVKTG